MSATTASDRPRARRQGLIVRELQGETLVYDRERHRAHCLEPMLGEVWRACDGTSTVDAIAAEIGRRHGTALDRDAVAILILRLQRARLLEGPRPRAPRRPDRREVLLRLAGLSGVALVSVVAPTALEAATCTPAAQCATLPNGRCTGLPCCENTALKCTKPNNQQNCGCN
jgi:hypothetical protein